MTAPKEDTMSRIYNPENTTAGSATRWQDDPNTGEFSEYGRRSHLAAALVTLISMLCTLAAVAVWLRWMLG